MKHRRFNRKMRGFVRHMNKSSGIHSWGDANRTPHIVLLDWAGALVGEYDSKWCTLKRAARAAYNGKARR